MATPVFYYTPIKETSRHRLIRVKIGADTSPAYAIKVTKRQDQSSIEREKRLIQHITAPNNARHLIQLLPIKIPSMASQPHYVMEYLQHDLYHYIYIKHHVRSVWFSQLCHALVTLTRYKITHGDIKPENVMMRVRQPVSDSQQPIIEAVLIDFDAAHTTPDVAKQLGITASRILGTLGYLAPEVVALHEGKHGQAGIGPHSDIWSLGSMSLEALFNYRPQQPSTTTSQNTSHLREHIEAVKQDLQQYRNGPILFPDEACFTFFSAMMHQNPRHRPNAKDCANFFRDHAQTLDQHYEDWRDDKPLPLFR